jgi:hypothetical protein
MIPDEGVPLTLEPLRRQGGLAISGSGDNRGKSCQPNLVEFDEEPLPGHYEGEPGMLELHAQDLVIGGSSAHGNALSFDGEPDFALGSDYPFDPLPIYIIIALL